MKVKGYSWVGVGTNHFAATLSFFTTVLGLRPLATDERGVAILEVSGRAASGDLRPPHEREATDVATGRRLRSGDVAAARDELLANGVEVIGDIGSWNGFEWLYFYGPDRNVYSLKKTPPAGWERN